MWQAFTRDVPAISRNTLSLTAHITHTALSNLLISLLCRSHPSWGHSKTCAQKTVFSRSSSLFSSVHCIHSAHGTGRVTEHAPYSPAPPHYSIGKAVNMRDLKFGTRPLYWFPTKPVWHTRCRRVGASTTSVYPYSSSLPSQRSCPQGSSVVQSDTEPEAEAIRGRSSPSSRSIERHAGP
jgi:hypothetical protein